MNGASKTKVIMNYSPGSSPEPELEEFESSKSRSRKNSKGSSNRSSPIPLEKLHAFPSWIETDGQRLLWALAINDTEMALQYISEETANSSDANGFYAIHYAVLGDNKTAMKRLLECGAITRVQTKDKKTPFLLAFEHKRPKTFRALTKHAPREEQEEVQRRDKTFIPQLPKE
jgi:ankyrin repeat protein